MKLSLLAFLGSLAATLAMAEQKLCDQYGYYASDGYYFNNNMWGKDSGSGSQCLKVFNTKGGGVSWQADWAWSGGQNHVKSYPHVGKTLNPKLVSQIGGLKSSASWSYTGNNIRANVAYDLFTAADQNHATSSGDYELMVWLGRLGSIYPIGSSVGKVNVGGRTWELFDGHNGAIHVYSFVASSPIKSWNGDLMDFFHYLTQSKGFPASKQYLIMTQFGTEPFTGGPATFQVQNWNADMD